MLHEERNVFRPLFERRELNRYYAETIIKVFAKLSCPNQRTQILIRSRNDPHIDRNESVRAHAPHLLFLQNPKQFHLKAQTGLRNLVQENRAAIGCLKQAAVACIRPGERALLLSEQLAFQNSRTTLLPIARGQKHRRPCVCTSGGPTEH